MADLEVCTTGNHCFLLVCCQAAHAQKIQQLEMKNCNTEESLAAAQAEIVKLRAEKEAQEASSFPDLTPDLGFFTGRKQPEENTEYDDKTDEEQQNDESRCPPGMVNEAPVTADKKGSDESSFISDVSDSEDDANDGAWSFMGGKSITKGFKKTRSQLGSFFS